MENATTPTSTSIVRRPKSLEIMAGRLNLEPLKLTETLKATVCKGLNDAEFVVFVTTCNEYQLNPFLKQIYAFPAKGGGIVPVVSVDGWISIVNRQAQFDGCEFEFGWTKEGVPNSCTCTMFHKNRTKPVKITEYYKECYRKTQNWDDMPCRMLRHKAYIQAARVAFGLAGIYDEDEAQDIMSTGKVIPVEPVRPPEMIPGLEPEALPEPQKEAPKIAVRRRVPQRAQPAQAKPEPAKEPEPTEEPMGQGATVQELNKLMVASNVVEDQVLIYCREMGLDENATSLEELDHSTMLKLITTWKTCSKEISEIVV